MRPNAVAATEVLKPDWVVYRIYGDADNLLYIGMTRDLKARLRTHRRGDWGSLIRSVQTEGFPSQEEAAEHEEDLIASLHPRMNVAHRRFSPDGPPANVIRGRFVTCRYCHSEKVLWARGRTGKPYLVEGVAISKDFGIGNGLDFHRCPAFPK